ncbi:MAG: FmdB family zinc ribbon protein [Candidatus Acetothermia bacterium]
MPLYKYRCNECDNTFRVLRKNGKKDEIPECPECGSTDVERLISSVGLRFKGNGFYRTDYDNNSSYKDNGGKNEDSGSGNGSKNQGEAQESSSGEV